MLEENVEMYDAPMKRSTTVTWIEPLPNSGILQVVYDEQPGTPLFYTAEVLRGLDQVRASLSVLLGGSSPTSTRR